MKPVIPALLLSLFLASTAAAQTPKCDALSGEQAETAKKVMDSAYPYDCCDETISKCMQKQTSCKLVKHLADEVCHLVSAGKNVQEIKHILDQRAMTMTDLTPAVQIAKYPEHIWGNPQAKVVLSVYLCGRCPYCSRFVPELIKALEAASLKDKVAVNLRLFPIKTHENSTQAAIAVEAAAKLGHGWDFLLSLYRDFDNYSQESVLAKATELGLNSEEFSKLMQESSIREKVVQAKKEGLTNNVESTPTFFLNGRKILIAFDTQSILSMIQEAVDK